MGHLTFTSHESVSAVKRLEAPWRGLHADCTYPSLYNDFDFFISSTIAFSEPNISLYVLAASDGPDVVAIFPFQLSLLRRNGTTLRLLEYAAQWEIDKPYPLIRTGYEDLAWAALALFLRKHRKRWDRFDLMEVRDALPATTLLPRLLRKPVYWIRVRADRQTPLVSLNRPWEDRWRAHQKMRKKVARIQNTFGERMRFQVFQDADAWESCLATYMDLEARGWKAGRVGIGKNLQTVAFYREFFPRIAASGALRFGFLFVDDEVIAAEVAYINQRTVYFAHGTYDERYAKYSPGMVSRSLFLRYFHGSQYDEGDYLAGYTGYLLPWADRIVPSYKVTVFRISAPVLYSSVVKAARSLFTLRKSDQISSSGPTST